MIFAINHNHASFCELFWVQMYLLGIYYGQKVKFLFKRSSINRFYCGNGAVTNDMNIKNFTVFDSEYIL